MIPIGYHQKKLYDFFTVIHNRCPIGTHWVSQPYTHQGICVWDFGLVCCGSNSSNMSQNKGLGLHGHKQTPLEQ
jgi:hypothetical protein